jgi:hypothetical protein
VDGNIHTANWTEQFMDVDYIRIWQEVGLDSTQRKGFSNGL